LNSSGLPLGLATVALVVAGYAIIPKGSTSESEACDCDTSALQAEVAQLKRRVELAERTAAQQTVRRAVSAAREPDPADPSPVDSDPPDADADAPPEPTAAPRFTSFDVAEPGVTVSQSEDGGITVRNTNPTLEGNVLIVQARGEDGLLRDVPITVPPAE